MEWINCENVPNLHSMLPIADDGRYCEGVNFSIECLFTDGKSVYIGQAMAEIEDNELVHLEWLAGSEGWRIENVTHWGHLPELPG